MENSKRSKRVVKAKEAEKELMIIVSALLSLKSTGTTNKQDCSSKNIHDNEMKQNVKKSMCLSTISSSKNDVKKYSGQKKSNCKVNPSYNYRNYWADKKIRVSEEALDKVDNFTWRSNGTKKLVGLSHLRRYYRCGKKGCSVHKIVDYDPNDPSMLIICYNGEHNHTIP